MAQPSSRSELKEYCLKQLGKPVLEINVDDDQIDDLIDDALQYFNERHYDGVERVFLKHKVTTEEKESIRSGVTTTTATSSVGVSTVSYNETTNFLKLPDTVIGVNGVFKIDSSTVSGDLFNLKYQLFLNDLYYYGALDLLNYAMVKTHLEDIGRLLTPDVQLRFNKKQGRLYLDIDWESVNDDTWLVFDCYRIVDPLDFTKVYNDWWLKKYLTALIKKQWGMNMIKFNGVQLPGGITLNGRQLYDDAVNEITALEEKLHTEYEMPPLDMIG